MMREKGIFRDEASSLAYFTGYSYQTLYDWDQYFEAIIQMYIGWDMQLAQNGIHIFLANADAQGFIYRSVPRKEGPWGQKDEQVKPFLAQTALLIYRHTGSLDWLSEDEYRRLRLYMDYWLHAKDKNGNHLSTWDSAPHTGMDNQHSRAGYWYDCFCEGVDLNCYIVRELRALACIAQARGREADAAEMCADADLVAQAVQTLWDEQDGIFYDRDERTGQPIRVRYVGAFATLWAGIATSEQAARMVREHITNPDEFWRAFPLPGYAATEPDYSEHFHERDARGCNWLAHTWLPTNYYVFHGLLDYGYEEIARELAEITCRKLETIGDREYYVTDREAGAGLDPFWGWSLLGYFMPDEQAACYDPTHVDDWRYTAVKGADNI